MQNRTDNQFAAANTSRLFEVALWMIGLACVGAYGVSKVQAARAQSVAMSSLEAQWQRAVTVEPDQSLWSKARIEHYEGSRSRSETASPLALLSFLQLLFVSRCSKERRIEYSTSASDEYRVAARSVPMAARRTGWSPTAR